MSSGSCGVSFCLDLLWSGDLTFEGELVGVAKVTLRCSGVTALLVDLACLLFLASVESSGGAGAGGRLASPMLVKVRDVWPVTCFFPFLPRAMVGVC